MRFDDIRAPFALRAAEVALAGSHSIVFIGGSMADDLADLVNAQGLQAYSWDRSGPMPEADMYVHVQEPSDRTPYGEPHGRVIERIRVALASPDPTEGLSVQGEALLNVAARQLGLHPDKMAEIVRITKAIARLARSDRMDTAFLCEAIQYMPRRSP